MKKHCCIFFAAVFVLGLLMFTANSQATEAPKIHFSGLIEVGGVWQDIDYEGAAPDPEDVTDLCLTTVELEAEAELNEWVSAAALLLYEDPTFGDETNVEIDEAMVTIGNTEEYPLSFTAGKMYVPFGALLTHFPDDPLIDAPVTLVFGETLEKALLLGLKHGAFSVSAYAFNGDMDEYGEDNNIESFGVDVNYSMDDGAGFDFLLGGSFISNITDSDGFEEALTEALPELQQEAATYFGVPLAAIDIGLNYLAGAAGYVHVGFNNFFVDGEYMTALDEVEVAGTVLVGPDAGPFDHELDIKPAVWNVEAGMDVGKNLQIVLKYAGSNEAEVLGLPEQRYGICLNQDIFEDVVLSLGYLKDDYDEDEMMHGEDERDLAFVQMAVEF